MVFNKSLMLSSAAIAEFSTGTVQTLMSVDADRVVNLCTSLHELWSLPLQIAAALILLYTQVRYLQDSVGVLSRRFCVFEQTREIGSPNGSWISSAVIDVG